MSSARTFTRHQEIGAGMVATLPAPFAPRCRAECGSPILAARARSTAGRAGRNPVEIASATAIGVIIEAEAVENSKW
jgi:hypothetical protein